MPPPPAAGELKAIPPSSESKVLASSAPARKRHHQESGDAPLGFLGVSSSGEDVEEGPPQWRLHVGRLVGQRSRQRRRSPCVPRRKKSSSKARAMKTQPPALQIHKERQRNDVPHLHHHLGGLEDGEHSHHRLDLESTRALLKGMLKQCFRPPLAPSIGAPQAATPPSTATGNSSKSPATRSPKARSQTPLGDTTKPKTSLPLYTGRDPHPSPPPAEAGEERGGA